MAFLDTLYYHVTLHSGRILLFLLSGQAIATLTMALLVSLNSYAVYRVTEKMELCTLYMTPEKFHEPLAFLQDAGCRTSINASLAMLAFTVGIIVYHLWVERSGKMAVNIYSNVQQRWFWSFAACGAVVALTTFIFAVNTTAGFRATCNNVNAFRERFAPEAPEGSVSCSAVLDSDDSSRYSRLSAAVGLSWFSLLGWVMYIAMYVAAARSY